MARLLCRQSSSGEEGAALITAMLIVAMMSVAALGVMEAVSFSVRVHANIAQREQARLYALSGEQLVVATLRTTRRLKADAERYPELDEWTRAPVEFPTDGGGIRASVRDGANCFNLNAVVRKAEAGNALVRDDAAFDGFVYLLETVGVPPGEALSAAGSLLDWIDTDETPSYGGAEDYHYGSLSTPYRTAGQLLADVSELNIIEGFTPSLVQVLKPLVCVRPFSERHALNINTLSLEQAPVLAAYLGREFDFQSVRKVFADRPVSGFASVDAFYTLPMFGDEGLAETQRPLFALKSDIYDVRAMITHFDTVITVTSSLQISPSGDITNISRRYGYF